jgi:type II secretory pathway component PulK
MTRPRDESGIVLLLVLAVIVLTTSAVYAFARISLLSNMAQHHRTDRVRADLLARSGVAVAIRALQDDLALAAQAQSATANVDSHVDPWYLLGEQPIAVPGGGQLLLIARDVGNRVNLNALVDAEGGPYEASRPFLLDALERIIEEMPGRTEEKFYKAQDLADGILDWLDTSEETRLGDDEADYYDRLGAKSPPPNRRLFALEELAGLPGADDELLQTLAAYFTTHPTFPADGMGGVNPNTAPPHVLGLIYQGTAGDMQLLDEDGVFSILRARSEDRIFCPASNEEPCVSYQSEIGRVGEGVFPPLSFSSQVFSIRSEASFGESRACIQTVVDRRNLGDVATLSYWMGC